MSRRQSLIAVLVIVVLGASGVIVDAACAQKSNVPKQPDPLALASGKAVEILVLMDTDKNGKVSKQEWMKFMEAEFDRLDRNRKGELDPKELRGSILSVRRHPTYASAGK